MSTRVILRRAAQYWVMIPALVGLLTLTAAPLSAQALGVVNGVVRDSITAEPMIGVTVIVQGQNKFAQTDFDGKFQVQLEPGDYTIVFQMSGMESRTRQVTVKPGQAVSVNIAMGTPAATEAEVLVTDRALNNTEASLLALQKKSGGVSDGISAEKIKKSPDSSAGDVIKRVTGISLVDGRFVFVRGLGERYSNTVLNGVTLPSPQPDKRVVPLDLFPASLLKNIRVIKTFLPENPAEFSGGLVEIETKEFPDQFEMSLGIGIGYNSRTTMRHFKTFSGGGNDYLGLYNDKLGFGTKRYDKGDIAKQLPDIAPYQPQTLFGGLPPTLIAIDLASLPNNWDAKTINAPFDRDIKFSIGDSQETMLGRFGYLYGTSYSRKWRTRKIKENRFQALNLINPFISETGYILPIQERTAHEFKEEVLWGNNLNLALEPNANNQFTTKIFYANQSEKEIRQSTGLFTQNDTDFIAQTNSFISQEMLSMVFGGKHLINLIPDWAPHTLEWHTAYSEANRNQPDLKQQSWKRGRNGSDPNFTRTNGQSDGSRYWSVAEDTVRNLGATYEIPFTQWSGLQTKLKVGAEATDRQKYFDADLYDYRRTGGATDLDIYPVPGSITFNPTQILTNAYTYEGVPQANNYDALQKLHAYFGQVDLPITPELRFIGGVRYEDSFQYVKTFNENQITLAEYNVLRPGIGEIRTKDRLPSVNFRYEPVKDHVFRVGYSETITRPDFRELSSFAFSPYFGADQEFGNPNLKRSYIHNYDLRYEYYMSGTEYAGIGIFEKQISNPIELVGIPVAGGGSLNFTYANAKQARIHGLEVDVRKDILPWMNIGANAFLIRSSVEVLEYVEAAYIRAGLLPSTDPKALYSPSKLERPLVGQSELVMNVSTGFYFNTEKTMLLTFYYNYYGDRLASSGSEGAPDVVEQGVGILDIVYTHNIGDKWEIKASVKNALDARFKATQRDEVFDLDRIYYSYRRGTDISLSASYKF